VNEHDFILVHMTRFTSVQAEVKRQVEEELRRITRRLRLGADGRWSLRMTLEVPGLLPVFTALCHDVVEATRSGVSDSRAASAFLGRIERWRRLLDKDASDLSGSAALGLIGELTVLLSVILRGSAPLDAVSSWTGPLGTPQDFILPSGQRLEVKAIDRHASTVRINGLTQLASCWQTRRRPSTTSTGCWRLRVEPGPGFRYRGGPSRLYRGPRRE